MLVDVLLEHFGQSLGQRPSTQIFGVDVPVDGMTSEILLLLVQGNCHLHFVVDVLLGAVLDTYKPQLQGDLLVHDHPARVGTPVHDVYFGDDPQSPRSLRIPLPG